MPEITPPPDSLPEEISGLNNTTLRRMRGQPYIDEGPFTVKHVKAVLESPGTVEYSPESHEAFEIFRGIARMTEADAKTFEMLLSWYKKRVTRDRPPGESPRAAYIGTIWLGLLSIIDAYNTHEAWSRPAPETAELFLKERLDHWKASKDHRLKTFRDLIRRHDHEALFTLVSGLPVNHVNKSVDNLSAATVKVVCKPAELTDAEKLDVCYHAIKGMTLQLSRVENAVYTIARILTIPLENQALAELPEAAKTEKPVRGDFGGMIMEKASLKLEKWRQADRRLAWQRRLGPFLKPIAITYCWLRVLTRRANIPDNFLTGCLDRPTLAGIRSRLE